MKLLNSIAAKFGYCIRKENLGLTGEEKTFFDRVAKVTASDALRITALREAVHYVGRHHIPGDFVECGVFKGGSAMAMAYAMHESGFRRTMWLFDTYEGIPMPGVEDVTADGRRAADYWDPDWYRANRAEVERNMRSTYFPMDKVHLLPGMIEKLETGMWPPQIALLHIDLDLYEGTKAALEKFYWLVAPGGVLIVDDYGHWRGARKAVDEFFRFKPDPAPFIARIGYTAVALIKHPTF